MARRWRRPVWLLATAQVACGRSSPRATGTAGDDEVLDDGATADLRRTVDGLAHPAVDGPTTHPIPRRERRR